MVNDNRTTGQANLAAGRSAISRQPLSSSRAVTSHYITLVLIPYYFSSSFFIYLFFFFVFYVILFGFLSDRPATNDDPTDRERRNDVALRI